MEREGEERERSGLRWMACIIKPAVIRGASLATRKQDDTPLRWHCIAIHDRQNALRERSRPRSVSFLFRVAPTRYKTSHVQKRFTPLISALYFTDQIKVFSNIFQRSFESRCKHANKWYLFFLFFSKNVISNFCTTQMLWFKKSPYTLYLLNAREHSV